MKKIYGYARCSTNESKQDINRQKKELYKLGVESEENIYWEYESGTKNDRAEFNKLLNVVEEGETIATTEVSRLSRSTSYLCEVLKIVQEKKLRLIIGTFVIDCRTNEIDPMTKGMLMMWGVFAEMERDMISARVKSGLDNARSKGKTLGRPKTTKEDIPNSFLRYYPMFQNKEINLIEFMRLSELSKNTIYKYIKIINS